MHALTEMYALTVTLYTVIVQPLTKRAPYFCLLMYGSDIDKVGIDEGIYIRAHKWKCASILFVRKRKQ